MTLPHLYLCRHGQTDWNAEERLQGQVDVALNERGRTQARRNGQFLASTLGSDAKRFRFVASPMMRTVETMRIIRLQMGLDPDAFETDDRLIELHFGDWEGSTLEEIEALAPGTIADRESRKWDYRPPGDKAESYELLARRVAPVFDELTGPTIMVAHGGVVRCFLKMFGGVPPAEAAHATIVQDRVIEAVEGRIAWV